MNRYVIFSVISIALFFFSCGDEIMTPENSNDLGLSKGRPVDVPRTPGELTEMEIEGLIHARQEEKVARDVYTVLFAAWGEDFIVNIMASEQKHMDAVKRMLTKYDVEDPVISDEIGEFSDEYFTDMYNELIALGTGSEKGAIQAGILIEESSIAFLEDQLTFVAPANLRRVYTNLLRGSNRHLQAFLSHLQAFPMLQKKIF